MHVSPIDNLGKDFYVSIVAKVISFDRAVQGCSAWKMMVSKYQLSLLEML